MSNVGVDDHIKATDASAEDLERLPRVSLAPTLAPEALYGFAGRVVETIDPYTEADPVATLGHLLVGIGNLIGSAPHVRVQHDEHPARLNVAFIGPSSKGRKGTAFSTPKYMLAQVDEEWARERIEGGMSSGEGVIYHVRDPRRIQEPIREEGPRYRLPGDHRRSRRAGQASTDRRD